MMTFQDAPSFAPTLATRAPAPRWGGELGHRPGRLQAIVDEENSAASAHPELRVVARRLDE